MSRTADIEEKWNVKLRRENYDGFLTYDIIFPNGESTCEWLMTLDDVEKYLIENKDDLKQKGVWK